MSLPISDRICDVPYVARREQLDIKRHGHLLAQLLVTKLGSVVIVLLVAGCGSGSPASVTSAPRSPGHTAASTDNPSPSEGGRTHVLSDASDGAIGITVTVPAPGWSGPPGKWFMEWGPKGFDPPDGAGIIAFVVDKEFYVYGDPCDWRSTRPKAPATTVDELVSALANQASRNPSAPEKITVGGYSGKKITLHVPDDARFKDCDGGTFSTLGVAVDRRPHLWAQGPGEIDEIWIVDVNGRIALLEGGYYAKTPDHAVDELHAILSSATFD
jgi:hypothetical protein